MAGAQGTPRRLAASQLGLTLLASPSVRAPLAVAGETMIAATTAASSSAGNVALTSRILTLFMLLGQHLPLSDENTTALARARWARLSETPTLPFTAYPSRLDKPGEECGYDIHPMLYISAIGPVVRRSQVLVPSRCPSPRRSAVGRFPTRFLQRIGHAWN